MGWFVRIVRSSELQPFTFEPVVELDFEGEAR
jgi:hypothetical protein